MPEPPGQLSLERHRDLRGRARHVWARRAILLVVAALPVLGLINFFGQHPVVSRASGPDASLKVSAPDRLRGGLIYQVRFDIRARKQLAHPTLILDRGWFESMTLNALAPDASQQNN